MTGVPPPTLLVYTLLPTSGGSRCQAAVSMLHVEVSRITGDPRQLADAVTHVR